MLHNCQFYHHSFSINLENGSSPVSLTSPSNAIMVGNETLSVSSIFTGIKIVGLGFTSIRSEISFFTDGNSVIDDFTLRTCLNMKVSRHQIFKENLCGENDQPYIKHATISLMSCDVDKVAESIRQHVE